MKAFDSSLYIFIFLGFSFLLNVLTINSVVLTYIHTYIHTYKSTYWGKNVVKQMHTLVSGFGRIHKPRTPPSELRHTNTITTRGLSHLYKHTYFQKCLAYTQTYNFYTYDNSMLSRIVNDTVRHPSMERPYYSLASYNTVLNLILKNLSSLLIAVRAMSLIAWTQPPIKGFTKDTLLNRGLTRTPFSSGDFQGHHTLHGI